MDIKSSLGFGPHGYITIFKGKVKEYDDWFRDLPARYSKFWGWYLPEDESIGSLPFGVSAARLNWEDISSGELLKPEREIRTILDNMLYEPDSSQYLGEVGETIQAVVQISKAVPVKTTYGDKILYVLNDIKGNHVLWTTTVALDKNAIYLVTGEISKVAPYRNSKQTTLKKVKYERIDHAN